MESLPWPGSFSPAGLEVSHFVASISLVSTGVGSCGAAPLGVFRTAWLDVLADELTSP